MFEPYITDVINSCLVRIRNAVKMILIELFPYKGGEEINAMTGNIVANLTTTFALLKIIGDGKKKNLTNEQIGETVKDLKTRNFVTGVLEMAEAFKEIKKELKK